MRSPAWQKEFLDKSIAERDRIVRDFREISKNSTAAKKPEIMDVHPDAVEAALRQHGVRHLIHGHTHRPAQHVLALDGQSVRRTVLGDWYDQGSVLVCDAKHCVLENLN